MQAHFLSLYTPSTKRWGQKVKQIMLLKVVMLIAYQINGKGA